MSSCKNYNILFSYILDIKMITSDRIEANLLEPVDVLHNNSQNMFNLATPCCFCCTGIIFI